MRNEAEVKELRKRLETLELTHAAQTRERNELSKEVRHTRGHLHHRATSPDLGFGLGYS